LLNEESPLRTKLYPYRKQSSGQDWPYHYEKILVEREVLADAGLLTTVLRLPKVYGPGGNSDLATVYAMSKHPQWRWTHGYVENVVAAITAAATHPKAGGRIHNVGEEYTPTVAERLAGLPPSDTPDATTPYHFEPDLAYDTSRIRSELGYIESVAYDEGLQRTLKSSRT